MLPLGATRIIYLLSKDLVILVLVSFAVASPLAWWVMDQWLQNFAHRVDISWQIFALAGFLTVFVAFLAVSIQSMKAAVANPIESIRTEEEKREVRSFAFGSL